MHATRPHGLTLPLPKVAALTFSMACSFLSCTDFGDIEPLPPRIIPGVSIDGIQLGYSTVQVESVLGSPISKGWAEGVDRLWTLYEYYPRVQRSQSVLLVWFLETPEIEWGPVDLVSVGAGYPGKTKEGIGIGSHCNAVLRAFGLPAKSVSGDTTDAAIDYWYCVERTTMIFRCYRDTVGYIDLGPSIPYSFSPRCE